MTQIEADIPGLAHAVRWNMRLACDTSVLSWFCFQDFLQPFASMGDCLWGPGDCGVTYTLGYFGKSGIEKVNLICSFTA